jgi:hypothetical protein
MCHYTKTIYRCGHRVTSHMAVVCNDRAADQPCVTDILEVWAYSNCWSCPPARDALRSSDHASRAEQRHPGPGWRHAPNETVSERIPHRTRHGSRGDRPTTTRPPSSTHTPLKKETPGTFQQKDRIPIQQAQQEIDEDHQLPSPTRLYSIEPLPSPSPGTVPPAAMVSRRHTVAGYRICGPEWQAREDAELCGKETERLGDIQVDFGGDFQAEFEAEMKKWLAPF